MDQPRRSQRPSRIQARQRSQRQSQSGHSQELESEEEQPPRDSPNLGQRQMDVEQAPDEDGDEESKEEVILENGVVEAQLEGQGLQEAQQLEAQHQLQPQLQLQNAQNQIQPQPQPYLPHPIQQNQPQPQLQPQLQPQFQPQHQPQPQLRPVQMATSDFFKKIPNREALRDFFSNACQRYCPPKRELTLEFCKVPFQPFRYIIFPFQAILKGEKKLLKTAEVKWIEHVPNYTELTSSGIWKELCKDPVISLYFPSYSKSRSPQKKYLLNVVNTLRPNSIAGIVKTLREKRQNIKVEEESIVMVSEFQLLLNTFQTMSTDTKVYGLGRLRTVNYSNCPICFMPLKKKKRMAFFKCKRHQAHKKCAYNYEHSGCPNRNNYLCPLRCSQALD